MSGYKRIFCQCILIAFILCAIIKTGEFCGRAWQGHGDFSDPMLIIDPGHGGADGGAGSLTGATESEINLSIALKLRNLCDFLGISSVMTRETESISYPEDADSIAEKKRWDTNQRVRLAKQYPGAVFLSLHQNFYPAEGPFGSEVLYGTGGDSKNLAGLLHDRMVRSLNPENRRVAAPISPDIYIMKHAPGTAVLVECGFISNPRESVLLDSDSYKLKIATVLAAGLTEYWEEQ